MALPFSIDLQPGAPLGEQLIHAVKKAVISGLLQPGERFPSVRVLSQELRINPNTAHKAVGLLMEEGILVVEPGVGTRVGKIPPGTARDRGRLLGAEVERLVIEARVLQLSLAELQQAIAAQWKGLS